MSIVPNVGVSVINLTGVKSITNPTEEKNNSDIAVTENDRLVDVKGLKTYFHTEAGTAKAIDGVDFFIKKGEVLGLVGESGSGKSVASLSLLRLIPDPPGKIIAGEIFFQGKDLLKLPLEEMYRIRGSQIAMIFQEPMTSLNPVFTIGMQIKEIIQYHGHVPSNEVEDHAIKVLEQVGIADAGKRLNDYPHQFSGGMRQRVMIAIALSCDPVLLIADEPTTALDVTIQAQILDLMMEIKERREGAAILLITHDLAVVAETCQRVIVLYGGKIQETAGIDAIFEEPLHPYTKGLLNSLPRPDLQTQRRLYNIPGTVPSILNMPAGCKFSNRCSQVKDICHQIEPGLAEVKPGRWVRCHLYPESSEQA